MFLIIFQLSCSFLSEAYEDISNNMEEQKKTMKQDGVERNIIKCKEACELIANKTGKQPEWIKHHFETAGLPAQQQCYQEAILQQIKPDPEMCKLRAILHCEKACLGAKPKQWRKPTKNDSLGKD